MGPLCQHLCYDAGCIFRLQQLVLGLFMHHAATRSLQWQLVQLGFGGLEQQTSDTSSSVPRVQC